MVICIVGSTCIIVTFIYNINFETQFHFEDFHASEISLTLLGFNLMDFIFFNGQITCHPHWTHISLTFYIVAVWMQWCVARGKGLSRHYIIVLQTCFHADRMQMLRLTLMVSTSDAETICILIKTNNPHLNISPISNC